MPTYALVRSCDDRTKDMLVRFSSRDDLEDLGSAVGWVLCNGVMGVSEPPLVEDAHRAVTACDGTFGRATRAVARVEDEAGRRDIVLSVRPRVVAAA